MFFEFEVSGVMVENIESSVVGLTIGFCAIELRKISIAFKSILEVSRSKAIARPLEGASNATTEL
jgi:hypothetical protein